MTYTSINPPISPVSEPFWEGTRRRQLILQWCVPCDIPIHHPRALCPRCYGANLDWRQMSGEGRVHSWAWHPPIRDGDEGRMVAMVELSEGAILLTWILGGTDGIAADHPVRLTWFPIADARALPCFELTPSASVTSASTSRSPEGGWRDD